MARSPRLGAMVGLVRLAAAVVRPVSLGPMVRAVSLGAVAGRVSLGAVVRASRRAVVHTALNGVESALLDLDADAGRRESKALRVDTRCQMTVIIALDRGNNSHPRKRHRT